MQTVSKPTDILSAEHRVIETVLDVLEKLELSARRDRKVDSDSAAKVIRFLRTFADTCHHGKEEHRLFPMLHERGLPKNVGPVAVMLDEHESGRRLIAKMDAALAAAAQGEAKSLAAFCDAATSYVELLREHISKEDHVLFPMAEGMLRDEDRRRLFEAFEKVEHEELGVGLHQEMEEIARDLATRFQVKPSTERGAPVGGSCCGHHHPCH